jgi:nucleotide-binding universal stress UspA family protein
MACVDGSASGRRALEQACGLARAFGAELLVVHVFCPEEDSSFPLDDEGVDPRSEEELRQDAVELLDAHVGQIATLEGLRLDACLREGRPEAEIISLSEERAVSLIVLGRRGVSGFKRFFSGRVSYAVSRGASCSVLIVDS